MAGVGSILVGSIIGGNGGIHIGEMGSFIGGCVGSILVAGVGSILWHGRDQYW